MTAVPPDRPPTAPPNPITLSDDALASVRKMFSAEQYERTKSLMTVFCSSTGGSSLRAVAVAQSLSSARAMSVPPDPPHSTHPAPKQHKRAPQQQAEPSPVIPSPASTGSGGFERPRVSLNDAAELFEKKERDRRREKKRRHGQDASSSSASAVATQQNHHDPRYASGPAIKVEPPSYAQPQPHAEWFGEQQQQPDASGPLAHHHHHQHQHQHQHHAHQQPQQVHQQQEREHPHPHPHPAPPLHPQPQPFRRTISDTAAYVRPAMSTMDRFMEEKEKRDAVSRAAGGGAVQVKQEPGEEDVVGPLSEEGDSPTPSPIQGYSSLPPPYHQSQHRHYAYAPPSAQDASSLYPPPYHHTATVTPQKPSSHPTDPKSIPPTSSPFHPDLPSSSTPFPLPPGPRPTTKPAWSYAALIGQAINAAPTKRASLSQVYNWISTAYPFYRRSEAGWQNSIRHNLSLNECFVKIKREEGEKGKGCWWGIRPGDEVCFASGGFRKKGSSVRNPPGSTSSGSGGAGRKRKARAPPQQEYESEEEGSVRAAAKGREGAAAKRQKVRAAGGGAERGRVVKEEPIVWAVPDDVNHHFAVPPAYPPPPCAPTPSPIPAPASLPAPAPPKPSTPARAPSPLPPLAQQFPNMPGLTPSGPSSPPGPASSPLATFQYPHGPAPSTLQPNFTLPDKPHMPPPATPKSKMAEILGNRGSDRRLPAIPGMGDPAGLRTPPPKRGTMYDPDSGSGSSASGSKGIVALPSPYTSSSALNLNSTPSRALHPSSLFASPSHPSSSSASSSSLALFGTPLGRALASRWDMSDPATQANEDLQTFISSGTKLGLFESPVRGRGRGVWDSPGFEGW